MNLPWKRSKLRTIQDNLTKLNIARASLDLTGPARDVALVNASQLVTIFIYDCLVVFEDFKRAKDGHRQRVYGRLFSVVAVDAIKRCQNLLSPAGAELASIALANGLDKPLAQSKKELEAIERKHQTFLSGIRNTLIAHTGTDASEQLQRLGDLDMERLMNAAKDILTWIDRLQLDLLGLLRASGSAPADIL